MEEVKRLREKAEHWRLMTREFTDKQAVEALTDLAQTLEERATARLKRCEPKVLECRMEALRMTEAPPNSRVTNPTSANGTTVGDNTTISTLCANVLQHQHPQPWLRLVQMRIG